MLIYDKHINCNIVNIELGNWWNGCVFCTIRPLNAHQLNAHFRKSVIKIATQNIYGSVYCSSPRLSTRLFINFKSPRTNIINTSIWLSVCKLHWVRKKISSREWNRPKPITCTFFSSNNCTKIIQNFRQTKENFLLIIFISILILILYTK